jgi:phage-related protein
MPVVGNGVAEIRIRDQSGNYRAFYLARLERGVLVFHAFTAETRETSRRELERGRNRLQESLNE